MRRANPEWIYLARRAAMCARLTDRGPSASQADTFMTEWETEAVGLGRNRH